MQKFVPRSHGGIFAPNAPNPLHWTLNSCFGALHSVWVHLLSFRNCMKLGSKRCELVQLMQRFMPWSHVQIFRNDAPNPPHWTLNSCFGALHNVWVHLGPFCFLMKLGSKRSELVQLMQKFVPRGRVGIFRNERTRSTPLDPKLLFWCVSYILGVFRTIWLLHETRCKMGQSGAINAKVRATKSRLNLSLRTHPIHTIGP